MLRKLMLRFRLWLLDFLTPVTIMLGNVHLPFTRKRIKGSDLLSIQCNLKVGDVILSKTFGELTNFLIPGAWSHAMIYIGNDRIVEAVGKGVIRKDLPSAVLTKDEICILKPKFATEEEMELAALYAETQVGAPYDYKFMGNNQAFYCSELIYASYNEATNGKTPFKLRDSMGVPTAVPNDIFSADKKWEVKWIKTRDMK